MKKTLIPLLLAAVPCATVASAQDADPATPKPSDEAVERLEDLDEEINEFTQARRKEQSELRKKQAEEAAKAKAAGKPVPASRAISMRPDYSEFVDRAIAWADGAKGEDSALYLTKAVQLGGMREDTKGREAFDRLIRDHAASPTIAELGRMFASAERSLGEERTREVFGILSKSPDADVRGWVVLSTHSSTIEEAARDSEEYATARAAIMASAAEVENADLKGQLEGAIELREKLGVGAVAPDIEGIDIDGNAFKLSDYKGKVIFLDFWGDW